MQALSDTDFKKEVTDFKGVAVVDFWAEWCTPCHMLAPTIEELGKDYEGNTNVKIMKLNTDANPQTSTQFNIMSIPTVMVFKDGQVKKILVGVRGKDEYVDAIEAALE